MSSLLITAIVFACVFGGAVLGMLLRTRLPEHHLSADSKDVVKLGMGLIGTLTALVLGLLVASAKGTFDTQRSGVAQLAANVIVLDRTLAHYGKGTQETRELLRSAVGDLIQRTWPEDGSSPQQTEGRYEEVLDKIQQLTPGTDAQKTLQAQALKTATDTSQMRWVLFTSKGRSIPIPFLVVMVSWLVLILMSFGLFAPRNATAFLALLASSVAISSAIFLILELDRPFEGMIKISPEPLLKAQSQLGREALSSPVPAVP